MRHAANIVVTISQQLGSMTATTSPLPTPACSRVRASRSTSAANAALLRVRAASDTHTPSGSCAARLTGSAAIVARSSTAAEGSTDFTGRT